jgi:tRNA threonylcarbamoyladenosine biosynthesis protein TsaE
MSATGTSIRLTNEGDTRALSAYFAAHLQPGDTILLAGPVGAGKSLLCRSAIQTLMSEGGAIEDVPSPTFSLIQIYDVARGEVWHADLYRLSHPDELEELGIADALERQIVFVEWAERLGPLKPVRHIAITLDIDEADPDARRAEITFNGPDWDWPQVRL